MSRPIDWLRRRPLEAWITAALVLGSVVFIFSQLQPGLLLLNTTPAGGDMGAHVWGPAFLRDELLPRMRLSGWAPDWYDGFPAYQFYMVVPSLLIVFLDVVLFLPYNVAFKLVAVSGLLALPVAAWALGRLARLPFPTPAALAVATVPFVFDRSFSIYGGNAASTLAGEFAFTISLAVALVFLGLVLRGLDTGRSRALAAVALGFTVLCHLIPAIFAVVGAGIALLVNVRWTPIRGLAGRAAGNRLRIWWTASVVAIGGLLSGFWTIPFLLRHRYMTDMGWEKLVNYWQPLFPGHVGDRLAHVAHGLSSALGGTPNPVTHPVLQAGSTASADMTLVIALAFLGVGTSIVYRRRFGIWVSWLALALAVLFVVTPQGKLWNARLLPFWYLCLYFLAALAVVELIGAVAVLARKDRPSRAVLAAGPVVATLLTIAMVALPLRSLPFGSTSADGARYSWMGISTTDRSVVPDWARWNFSGYERKAAYPEYQGLVSAMKTVGAQRGCGRAMWEYSGDLDRFGTPMALMLLPYWTDGCIGSMEGLYFEASATTPYHFVNQSELSAAPSRAERGLPYGNLDVGLGVRHLQLLGVKYYMASSDAAIAQASSQPDLHLISTSGKWRVYEVAHAELVQPLTNRPAVVTDVPKTSKGWEKASVQWYLDPSRWSVMLADGGPSSWERVRTADQPHLKATATAKVTKIATSPEKISFDVDRVGQPVLVKASYFPNWKPKNATGPYRVAPNLMVVVPTGHHVTLEYARTSVDWLGILCTLLGVALVVAVARRRLRIPPRPPQPAFVPESAAPLPSPWPEDDVLATVGGGAPDGHGWGAPPEGWGAARRVTRRFRRFAGVSALVTGADLLALAAGRTAGLRVVAADAVAVAVASLLSFLVHRAVSFGENPYVRWVRQPRTFVAAAVVAGAIDVAVTAGLALVTPLGVAKVVALLAAGIVRFSLYRAVVLTDTRRDLRTRRERDPAEGEHRLTVVLPAYREAERVGDSVRRVLDALDDLDVEVVVVDDGSPDDTAACAAAAGARVVRLTPNQGKGAAVRAGVLAATGRTVAFTDVDLAYPPEQLRSLLAAVEDGWDVAVGNRRHPASEALGRPSLVRQASSKLFNLLTATVLLGQYRDTQCGCKAFRSDVARLLFGHARLDGFAFDVEVLHLVERYRLSLTEVPVRCDEDGTSTVRVVPAAVGMVRDLFLVRRWGSDGVYDLAASEEQRLAR